LEDEEVIYQLFHPWTVIEEEKDNNPPLVFDTAQPFLTAERTNKASGSEPTAKRTTGGSGGGLRTALLQGT
jgi:hypothetical protein